MVKKEKFVNRVALRGKEVRAGVKGAFIGRLVTLKIRRGDKRRINRLRHETSINATLSPNRATLSTHLTRSWKPTQPDIRHRETPLRDGKCKFDAGDTR